MSQAAVVSYNFVDNGTVGGAGAGSYPGATATAGVVDVGYWHNHWPSFPTFDLTNSLGEATTMNLGRTYNMATWAAANHPGQDIDGTWNREMLTGYLNGLGTNSVIITLTEIPYVTYDIYVYFMADDDSRVGMVSDGSTTYYFGANPSSIVGSNAVFTQTTATDSSGFNIDANYAVFSGLTGARQDIGTTFFASDQSTLDQGGIAGIQIVQVPEPATLGLIGFLGASMLFVCRRLR